MKYQAALKFSVFSQTFLLASILLILPFAITNAQTATATATPIATTTSFSEQKMKVQQMIDDGSRKAYESLSQAQQALSTVDKNSDGSTEIQKQLKNLTDIKACCDKLNFYDCTQQRPNCFSEEMQKEMKCQSVITEACMNDKGFQDSLTSVMKAQVEAGNNKQAQTNAIGTSTALMKTQLEMCAENKSSQLGDCLELVQSKVKAMGDYLSKFKIKGDGKSKSSNVGRDEVTVPTP